MHIDNNIRVCRVIPSYPSTQMPGGGLPAYYLSSYIKIPTLHIVRKQSSDARLASLPNHVQLKEVNYPDFAISKRRGLVRFVLGLVKAVFSLTFCLKSIPAMIRFRPTVIHVHTAIPLFHGLFGKYFLNARWVLTIHGSDFLEINNNQLLKKILLHVDEMCYVSENMGRELRQLFPGLSTHHTPSGVDLDRFTDLGLQRLPQIAMAGRLTWQKGYYYALHAFALFLKTHPTWKLVILGEGDERKGLENSISQLNLKDHVILLGMCSQDKVAKVIQSSSIFLLTSITEGFPKVLLEASACGTPVVATDVGDCKEVSDRAGITVPSRDIAALSNALVRLADDLDFWTLCSNNGKKLVEEYKWENIASCVAKIYE